MKTITINFTRNKQGKIFSRLLQWYEGIPISHVSVELDTTKGLGQPFVIHSVIKKGVSLIPMFRFLEDNEIMESYTIELSDEDYKSIRNELLDNCGIEYAYWQNIGILAVDVLKKLGFKGKNPFTKGQNCSELLYKHLISKIYDLPVDHTSDLIKPSQIRSILYENGNNPIFSKINNYSI